MLLLTKGSWGKGEGGKRAHPSQLFPLQLSNELSYRLPLSLPLLFAHIVSEIDVSLGKPTLTSELLNCNVLCSHLSASQKPLPFLRARISQNVFPSDVNFFLFPKVVVISFFLHLFLAR